MRMELRERTAGTAALYFQRTRDPEVRKFLPQKAATVEEALADFETTKRPGASSYGRTIYADGTYVGDIWCYCLQQEEPNAMVSYCIFDRAYWNRGAASKALELFLCEIREKFSLQSVGAFTFSANKASIRVLLKNGFAEAETFLEDGVESKYFQREWKEKTEETA